MVSRVCPGVTSAARTALNCFLTGSAGAATVCFSAVSTLADFEVVIGSGHTTRAHRSQAPHYKQDFGIHGFSLRLAA
jgi:hypothetical protein